MIDEEQLELMLTDEGVSEAFRNVVELVSEVRRQRLKIETIERCVDLMVFRTSSEAMRAVLDNEFLRADGGTTALLDLKELIAERLGEGGPR